MDLVGQVKGQACQVLLLATVRVALVSGSRGEKRTIATHDHGILA